VQVIQLVGAVGLQCKNVLASARSRIAPHHTLLCGEAFFFHFIGSLFEDKKSFSTPNCWLKGISSSPLIGSRISVHNKWEFAGSGGKLTN
jgi:hypothetical protein